MTRLLSVILLSCFEPALAQPIARPLTDATGHATVREAGRLLRKSLRRIRPDAPEQRRRLGFAPSAITQDVQGNIIVLRGENGEFAIDWTDPRAMNDALNEILISFYENNPGRNPHFLVINTTFLVEQPAAFYLPLANNVRGIGYEFDHESELFDLGGVALNGIIFMNGYRIYAQSGPIGRLTFNQEIGHRWGVHVRFADPDTGEPSDELLGRDCSHWSFFANTDNSSLEGNVWEDLGNGRFRTASTNMWGFTQLDRYLMGVVPKEAVGPIWFVRTADDWTCSEFRRGRQINPRWQPPTSVLQEGQVEVEGERIDVDIEDIIAVHGERFPDHATSRRTWKAAFLLVAKVNDRVDARALETVDGLRQDWERAFERDASTRGFAGPDLVTTLDGSRVDPPPPGGLPMGERCIRASDCEDGVNRCIGLGTGSRICTVECTDEAPCGEGFCCEASIPGEDQLDYAWYCLPQNGDQACGNAPVPFAVDPPDMSVVPEDMGMVVDADVADAALIDIRRAAGGDDGCRQGSGGDGWWGWGLLLLVATRRARLSARR